MRLKIELGKNNLIDNLSYFRKYNKEKTKNMRPRRSGLMNQNEIYANSIIFTRSSSGVIHVKKHHEELRLIGTGRSACVFQIQETNKVIKVFPTNFEHIAEEEADIYRELVNIDYFPTIYDSGSNYIVMDFIKGHTLFECLNKGIEISDKQIKKIDSILYMARKIGLNPSDIHLRNIIITTNNEIKIIDVARFRQIKNCDQWDDLKTAYYKYYQKRYFPRRIPVMILNMIASLYKKNLIPNALKH